ncbi:MAG TPA: SpoIID/LytB domain-containing protein, partial [Gaiellaceae bacterium]|nr:SpoIID/LytB domain-containing protein [Gaiellaceae bacterium]
DASATVIRVGRLALLACAAALLLGGAAAAALLAPGSDAAATSSSTTATTTTASAPPPASATSTAPLVVAFTGHGWGHGIGLGQWGAYGYALHGLAYDKILGHYYPGTTLGQAHVATVRVLVASKQKVTLASTTSWTIVDATGAKTVLDPGSLPVDSTFTVDGTVLEPPLKITAKAPLSVGGTAYRGKLTLALDGGLVDVVDTVGLEQYLKAVVPSEMPSRWPAAALEAQAVAARSYALANLTKGRPYDLYGDARSQVYGGVPAESDAASAAVDATKGQVVLYRGKVANALFFSTSGGRTVSALEATGVDVPYLASVADPYDTLSPYHDWGPVLYDAKAVAKQLKLSGSIASISVATGVSGRVKSLVVSSADDTQVTLTGNQVRNALGLRSTWFAPALLQLSPAARTITSGGALTLRGLAHGATGLSLEEKPAGSSAWADAGPIPVDPDGTFALVVKPPVTTQYRLAWGDARACLAKIAVAARVSVVVTPQGVQGTLRPLEPGAPVQLQQKQDDGTWATLDSAIADGASAWSFTTQLDAGTYRVRAAPGHGVAAGLSAPFTVQ